jgi:alpha-tubulin suppressor-like RCC1 family protein
MKKLLLVSFAILGFWLKIYSQSLLSWGSNEYGQLGMQSATNLLKPHVVLSDTNWVFISAGLYHSMGIKRNGTLWAWGRNEFGQLGLGDTFQYSIPQQVGSDSNWVEVCSGFYNTLALKTDGSLWGWGWNEGGELGLGNTNKYYSPQRIGNESSWLTIKHQSSLTYGIKKNGTLWGWGTYGRNKSDFTLIQDLTPKQIDSDSNWKEIDVSMTHRLGIKNDGTLWSWGSNTFGQLGVGNNLKVDNPQQVGNDTNWIKIQAGVAYSMALKNDGNLWTWGYNRNGQLGLGDTTNYITPQQLDSSGNWINISAGSPTFGIKKNGTLWAWGSNELGQLGLGNTNEYLTPQQVGLDNNWVFVSAINSFAIGLNKNFCINKLDKTDFFVKTNKCFGDSFAKIHLNPNGSFFPFKNYGIHGEKLDQNEISNLKSGNYKLFYTDLWERCKDSINIQIQDPKKLQINLESVIGPNCPGWDDGSAKISVNGGTGKKTTFWNDENQQNELESLNLSTGKYIIKVIDSNGCFDSISFSVPKAINTPPELVYAPTEIGAFNGTINIVVEYSDQNNFYQWQTNQGTGWVDLSNAGQYEGVISDSLIVSNITSNNNNQLFRCIVNNICGVDTTNEVRLSVWGVGSKDLHYNINVFPNPVSANLYINGSNKFDYKIKTTTGQDILNGSTSNGVVNMECLLPGVYFLHVLDYNQLVLVKTIIKE